MCKVLLVHKVLVCRKKKIETCTLGSLQHAVLQCCPATLMRCAYKVSLEQTTEAFWDIIVKQDEQRAEPFWRRQAAR